MTSETRQNTAVAAIFHEAGQPLQLERFPLPELKGGEALVRIRCATICGSDLHSYYGRRPAPAPSVLGHEMVGELVAAGPAGVRDFRGGPLAVGDRVTWSMVWSCGQCFFCQRGLGSKCERLMKFGHEAIKPGRVFLGGFAEYCHLPEQTAIFKIPDLVPDLAASPANCATATVAAVLRHAGPMSGQNVLVFGAGMLGLTACAMSSAAGAARVFVLEPGEGRRANALRFGATEAIDSGGSAEQIRSRILDQTEGRGADISLELSGNPLAVERGIELLRAGGRFILAGATFPARPVQMPADQIVRRMLQIIGVYNYLPEDLETALHFLEMNCLKYRFEELVSRQFPLTEINGAFAHASRQRPPRVAIVPTEGL